MKFEKSEILPEILGFRNLVQDFGWRRTPRFSTIVEPARDQIQRYGQTSFMSPSFVHDIALFQLWTVNSHYAWGIIVIFTVYAYREFYYNYSIPCMKKPCLFGLDEKL